MIISRENKRTRVSDPLLEASYAAERAPLDEETFRRMIAIERKRTERTKAPFLLMLIEVVDGDGPERAEKVHERILAAILASSRDTDLIGWYKAQSTIGVIFTGLAAMDKDLTLDAFLAKTRSTLQDTLAPEQFECVRISFHFFPDDWDHNKPGTPSNLTLYPDIASKDKGRRALLIVKRAIDIMGSATMLILCSPLFLIIALAIKLSSKGPVFYRQRRVGRYGQTFTFLKFRSMYVNNDCSVHREFAARFIAGRVNPTGLNSEGASVYKLTSDKRVTVVGRFLRRTSLDELPQFLNVLKGEMSLVGPRPPIPYELASYQIWHRRRLLAVKPGITGVWQVAGRSSIKFDEMVRLDLRYASTWTPWLDFQILLRTPLAVIRGAGAY